MLRKSYILIFVFFISLELFAQNKLENIDSAKNSLLRILETDSNNYSANYQLGMLYYEEAVNIIKETPYDIDIITLDKIQNESVELFREALPYLERAYHSNPAKKEVLSGLSALYFSLNNLDKAQEFENLNKK